MSGSSVRRVRKEGDARKTLDPWKKPIGREVEGLHPKDDLAENIHTVACHPR